MLADFGLSPIPDSGIPEGLSAEMARPLTPLPALPCHQNAKLDNQLMAGPIFTA